MVSKTIVKELVEQRISELNDGLFVVDISISPANVIHVELDKSSGYVSIQDCMSVSRNVEHNLDRESEDFELHVSSAGLDKPLRVLAQYEKNIGREVNVTLKSGEVLNGLLTSAHVDSIYLEVEKVEKLDGKKKKIRSRETINVSRNDIKETKIVITFK
jgi:ribosome maturation factor RimP